MAKTRKTELLQENFWWYKCVLLGFYMTISDSSVRDDVKEKKKGTVESRFTDPPKETKTDLRN